MPLPKFSKDPFQIYLHLLKNGINIIRTAYTLHALTNHLTQAAFDQQTLWPNITEIFVHSHLDRLLRMTKAVTYIDKERDLFVKSFLRLAPSKVIL